MSAVLAVRRTVADDDTWKVAYGKADAIRVEHGCTGEQVYRTPGDPHDVFATHDFPSVEQAEAFANDPALAAVMKSGGVSSAPGSRSSSVPDPGQSSRRESLDSV